MVFHMKTTLNIDDTVMARLRQEAARQRKTMSELLEAVAARGRLEFSDGVARKYERPHPASDCATSRNSRGGRFRNSILKREHLTRRAHSRSNARARNPGDMHARLRFSPVPISYG